MTNSLIEGKCVVELAVLCICGHRGKFAALQWPLI